MIATELAGSVKISRDVNQVATNVADWIARCSAQAISEHGTFSIALAGGSTPRPAYLLLSKNQNVNWSAWNIYFGDERACPIDDPRSNYFMARTTLLSKVTIPTNNVHRMHADSDDLNQAASDYADLLVHTVGDTQGVPRLDCVLLGLGENGHTASLFPGDPALTVTDTWCTTAKADYEPYDRLTLTIGAINAAAHVAFVVTGSNKRAALEGVISGTVPAARIGPDPGDLFWFLDSDAAS